MDINSILVPTILSLYFLIVPLLVGKILQDKIFVFRKGFAPIYALGFFVVIGVYQLLSGVLFILPREEYIIAWVFTIIFLIPVAYIIKNRNHLYRSEWKVGKATWCVAGVMQAVSMFVFFVVPRANSIQPIQDWDYTAISKFLSGELISISNIHLLTSSVINTSSLNRELLQIIFIGIPFATVIANVIVYFVDKVVDNTKRSMIVYSTLFAIFYHYLGFTVYGPLLIILAGIMFIVVLSLEQIKNNKELISVLPVTSIVYASIISFTASGLMVIYALTATSIIYLALKKEKYIVKTFMTGFLVPGFYTIIFLVSIDPSLAIASSMIFAMIILFFIFNMMNNYQVIETIEDRIIYWLKEIVIIGIVFVIGWGAYAILIEKWPFEWDSMTYYEVENTSRFILQISTYLIAAFLSVFALLKRRENVLVFYFSIFMLFIVFATSPIVVPIYFYSGLSSIKMVGYLFYAVYCFVFVAEYIDNKKLLYKLMNRFFLALIVILNIAYLIMSM